MQPQMAHMRDQDASTLWVPSQSESQTESDISTQSLRKPTMSYVILKTLADKRVHNCVSLAALKKAVSITGYNMTHNTWRFKRVLQNLLDKGMIMHVSCCKGASGSLCLCKEQALKSKHRAKRCQDRQKSQKPPKPRQRESEPCQLLLNSKKRNDQLFKGVRRVAKGNRHCH
ncbi:spermatid-specific linker histone H1-like protein [Mus caroli]|uniref:Histone H1.9 n=1 Tax=Mus caroli TaxID=10089 RepID=A0A6P5QPT1_MUSCR|nr:spermatid-specific linker histone H1-like protein [Mus caroli]